jgi:hypothetical protein
MAGVQNAVDRLRRPEHTGENRCLPCTVVNLVIAAVAGLALAVLQPVAGGVVFVLSVVVIYLRGYLVPGTPTLTRRYLPVRVLELFGKRPGERRPGAIEDAADPAERDDGSPGEETVESSEESDSTDDEGLVFVEDTTEFLFDAGIVRECDDSDDLRLTGWFRDAWEDRLPQFTGAEAAQVDRLAGMLDVDPDTLEVSEVGEAIVVERDGEGIGNWISRTAFAADMAADAVLEERIEGWSSIHAGQRSDMLAPLRGFLQTCPLCGGDIVLDSASFDESDPDGCCFESEIYSARCGDCGELFLEIEETKTDDEDDHPLGARA